ncbi:MAG: SCO family protein [Gammaproteobacteria bacterium]|nr:SCO family protein [Gammaproteobacteria bacterium]
MRPLNADDTPCEIMKNMSNTSKNILIIGLTLLAGGIIMLLTAEREVPPPVVATLLEGGAQLPEVRLIDKMGQNFNTSDLSDSFSLLFFGFTHCPDICPLTLNVLANMVNDWKIPKITPPEVIFVSVDGARDDPSQINNYLENFNTNFQGLSGSPEALDPLLKSLGVIVHTQHQPGEQFYSVTHNPTIYVISPEKKLIAVFSPPHEAEIIANDFATIRRHYLNSKVDYLEKSTP